MENEQNEIRRIQERNQVLKTLGQEDIFSFLERKKKAVVDGFDDAFKLSLFIKLFEEKLKTIKSEVLEQVIYETETSVEWQGYKFEQTSGGRYNYSKNKEWNELKSQIKNIEIDMQNAYKSDHAYINEETGEVIMPAVFMPNKTSIKITKIK